MKTNLFPELSDKETIARAVADNADGVETMTFEKRLNEEELAIVKDSFSSDAVELNQLEQELQTIKDEYKLKMKPVKDSMAATLGTLKTRQQTFTGNVYLYADQKSSLMGYYDERGELVHSRRLLPEERQITIFSAVRTGSND